MTVAELIAKLATLPPETIVVTDGNESFGYHGVTVYTFRGNVDRRRGWNDVWDDNGRDDVETIALITMFGHDDDKASL